MVKADRLLSYRLPLVVTRSFVCSVLFVISLFGYCASNLATNEVAGLAFIIMQVLFFSIASKDEELYCLFFYIPFYSYVLIFGMQLFNILMIVFITKKMLSGKIKISTLMLSLAIFFLELVQIMITKIDVGLSLVKLVLSIFVSLLILDERNRINIEKASLYFIIGIAFSSLYVLYISWGIILDPSSRGGIAGMGNLNQNTFALYCSVAYALGIIMSFSSKNRLLFILLSVICFIAGALTISKAFVLTAIIFLVLILIKINSIKLVFLSIVIGVILFVLFTRIPFLNSAVSSIINRFDIVTNIDDLTTGRMYLYNYYIDILRNNPLVLLFGRGLLDYQLFYPLGSRTHNILLEAIMGWGVCGSLAVVSFYIGKVKKRMKCNNTEIRYSNLIPFIIFLFFSMSLSVLVENVTWFIIILCVLVISDNKSIGGRKNAQ